MAHNKLYRNFIILQEDERGYSHSNDKTLSGYAKVEAKGDKCKVSFYAQNLKPEESYSMVLICCKRDLKQLIDLGPLAINEVGKGDTSKEYYVNNIAGLGLSYDKISGAAICRVRDNETDFIMHGFMNGEESTDNWRKFKFIRTDSKKYINKPDSELKKKDVSESNIPSPSKVSNLDKDSERVKLQAELVDRKNDESSTENKKCDELENVTKENPVIESRIPETNEPIDEIVNKSDEERHKNKEYKCDKHNKCDEHEKHEKYDKCDDHDKHHKYDKCGDHGKDCKHDKHEKDDEHHKCDKYDIYDKSDDIEDIIEKLSSKLDVCDSIIDIKMSYTEDIEVYGFIKYKKDYNPKWKKFKIEKKHREDEIQGFGSIQANYKRLEENFKLDKLNDINSTGRKDIIDFDEYENDIQQGSLNNTVGQGSMGQSGMGTTAQAGTGGQIGTQATIQTGNEVGGQAEMGTVGQTMTGTAGQTSMESTGQVNTGAEEQTGFEKITPITNETTSQTETSNQLDLGNAVPVELNNNQQTKTNQGFNITGEVTLYFEKLAQGFQPYNGRLEDINYCKWYKINVNGIEDLSDDSNYNQYTLAYYPMLNYYPYISKSGHFLLGYKCNRNGEIQYIVYAIPGSKEKNDQPYGGRTGFVTWTNDNNGRGYWLMFYDFKNSCIVIPTK